MDKLLHELGAALVAFLTALVPAALGAAVSLAYETGLSWTRRFVQMFVGICVSYFATNVVGVLWPWGQVSPFVLQAVSFVVGMIAFKATPRFMGSAIEVVSDLPTRAADLVPFLRRKDRP